MAMKDGKVILGQAVYPLIRPLEYKTGVEMNLGKLKQSSVGP